MRAVFGIPLLFCLTAVRHGNTDDEEHHGVEDGTREKVKAAVQEGK